MLKLDRKHLKNRDQVLYIFYLMEKQITLSDIRAVYTKDFETFGKMDPFLVFHLGKQQSKTETANDAGKEPTWKATIIFNYIDQTQLIIKSYEEDVTSNDYMGQGRVQLKDLKAQGDLEIKLVEDNNTQTGTIYCKYAIKNLPPSPFLTLKNIRCEIFKDTENIAKSKPLISVECNGNVGTTQAKSPGDPKHILWTDTVRLKIKDGQKIVFTLEDKDDKNKKFFTYEAYPKQFKTNTGNKKFYVVNRVYQQLGFLEFDYETQNFVTKEEAAKNEQAAKKQSNQLTQIIVESIKGNLNKNASDLYFKIILGPNFTKSPELAEAKKDFSMDVKQTLYADKHDSKIIFVAYDSEMIGGDTFKGAGELQLDSINGKSTVKLLNRQGNHFGDITVNGSIKKVPRRQLVISDIKIKNVVSTDVLGDSEMFVVGTVGAWTRRTEVVQGKEITLATPLDFIFSDEKNVILKVMDEDVTEQQLMYELKLDLQDFKESGEMTLPLIPEKYKDDKTKHGQITFKYKTKNGIYKDKSKSQAKVEEPKKQQIKKQQPKKEQTKKQEPKKTQKVETKKQQPKSQALIPEKKQTEEAAVPKSNKNVNEERQKKAKEQAKPDYPQPESQRQKPVKSKTDEKKQEQKTQKQKQSISHLKQQKSLHKDKSQQLQKSSLENSRNTGVKLPIIQHKNYGDKIYDQQSSSTLQKSIHVYSMPKANRFGSGPKYSGEPSYYIDSCFKPNSGKGAGFGFGSKRQFPQWMEKNMKQNPAPGAYLDQHGKNSEFRIKGPTFGISYKYYQKVTIPKEVASSGSKIRKSPEKFYSKR